MKQMSACSLIVRGVQATMLRQRCGSIFKPLSALRPQSSRVFASSKRILRDWKTYIWHEKMLRIYYINLDSSIGRRSNMEQMLSSLRGPLTTIERIKAIEPNEISEKQISSELGQGATACFLSHLYTLEITELSGGNSKLILEDDTKLSPAFIQLAKHLDHLEYDIIYLGINFGFNSHGYGRIASITNNKLPTLIDLKSIGGYAGAFAYYIPHGKSEKLYTLVREFGVSHGKLSQPIDLVYSQLIHSELIKGACLAPFFASLSNDNLSSTRVAIEKRDILFHTTTNSLFIDNTNEDYEEIKRLLKCNFNLHLSEINIQVFQELLSKPPN
jgi:hypothetical protein